MLSLNCHHTGLYNNIPPCVSIFQPNIAFGRIWADVENPIFHPTQRSPGKILSHSILALMRSSDSFGRTSEMTQATLQLCLCKSWHKIIGLQHLSSLFIELFVFNPYIIDLWRIYWIWSSYSKYTHRTHIPFAKENKQKRQQQQKQQQPIAALHSMQHIRSGTSTIIMK